MSEGMHDLHSHQMASANNDEPAQDAITINTSTSRTHSMCLEVLLFDDSQRGQTRSTRRRVPAKRVEIPAAGSINARA